MDRLDAARCLAALGLLCAVASGADMNEHARAQGAAAADSTADPSSGAHADEDEDVDEWVEFEDGHTGETVRAPARDQRDPEAPTELPPGAAPAPVAEEPPDDREPIATPTPTAWLPNEGSQCRRRRRHRFCDGPLRVPRPHGEAAALAERLHLGTRAGQFVLEHAARPEWVAAVEGRVSNTLRWPVDGGNLWRGLLPRRGRRHEHTGVDIGARAGTRVLAANDGLVIYAHNDITGYGNMVTVTHADGTSTMYAHLQAAYVFPGMQVRRAQVLGEVGETGIAHGTHLHFEWRIGGVPSNPLPRFMRMPERAERRMRQLEGER
jgi:murein DD-endopeptidase MepM/ murein hydrolase activator NlpD